MAAPVHVQTQIATDTNSVSSVTLASFAVGAGTDRSLAAFVCWRDDTAAAPPTGSTVVFNTSESYTFHTRAQVNFGGDNYVTVEAWTLDNPTNTTANVVATVSEVNDAGDGIALVVSEYTGANNGVEATTGSNTGLDNTPTVTFTTAADSLIVAGIAGQATVATSFTPGTGTTERSDGNIGEIAYWSGEEAATGGSDTIDASWTISSRWTIVAVALKAAAAGATYTLTCDAGSYTVTGQVATLLVSRVIAANTGSYTVTGQAASLLVNRVLQADAGSYLVTGQPASLIVGRVLQLDAGAHSIVGQTTALVVSRLLRLDTGSYAITGQAIQILRHFVLGANAGSYTIAGQAISLIIARIIALEAGSYVITGGDATLSYSGTAVVQTYTADVMANPSPSLSLLANATPAVNLAANPSPAKGVLSG